MTANFNQVMNTISDLTGNNENTFEKCFLIKLQDEIEILEQKISGSQQVIKYLDLQCDSAKAAYEAQLDVEKSINQSLKDDVESLRNKTEILVTYLAYVNTDDFEIIKVKEDVNNYCYHIRNELTPILEKKQELLNRWQELQLLASDCAEIKERSEKAIASLK